jgi:hypothetical protein
MLVGDSSRSLSAVGQLKVITYWYLHAWSKEKEEGGSQAISCLRFYTLHLAFFAGSALMMQLDLHCWYLVFQVWIWHSLTVKEEMIWGCINDDFLNKPVSFLTTVAPSPELPVCSVQTPGPGVAELWGQLHDIKVTHELAQVPANNNFKDLRV